MCPLFQDDQFVTGTLQGALSFDMSATSHPVVQDVNTPSEIKQMFDRIIYNKVCMQAIHLFHVRCIIRQCYVNLARKIDVITTKHHLVDERKHYIVGIIVQIINLISLLSS